MRTLEQKIRLPFLLLLLVIPLATLLLFNGVMRFYVSRNARNELKSTVQSIKAVVSAELNQGDEDLSGDRLENMLVKVNTAIRASRLWGNMELMVFGSQQELLYPRDESSGVADRVLTTKTRDRLSSMEDGRIYSLRAVNERYYLTVYSLTPLQEGGPILVLAAGTSAETRLIRVMNLILLAVMAIGAAVSALIANRMAARIARPVTRLCQVAGGIGRGEYRWDDQAVPPGDVAEIRSLYDSIRDMSDRLEANERARKTFFANASHELKTPLMSIQGYAEGIAGGVMQDTRHAAEVILAESRRLGDLVGELLTLSRIENRAYDREMKPLAVNDALREYVQRLGGLAARQQRGLTLDAPREPVLVRASDELLSQAITNIVSNCLRYARSAVTIGLRTAGNEVLIRIADDGCGIAPEDLPHLFERFYKGKGGSFGLGLAIAKSAVESMDGHVTASSSEQGAVFEMILPLCDAGGDPVKALPEGRPAKRGFGDAHSKDNGR